MSWAGSEQDVAERRAQAQRLEGARIASVRYVNVDYRRDVFHPELHGAGPRLIESRDELMDPTWKFDGFDAIDMGIELRTDDGRRFAVTWDAPGWHESLGLYEDVLIGTFVSHTADFAIWDVSREKHWAPLIGKRVGCVNLRYRPWSDDGEFWCPHISIRIADIDVEVIMGDAENGDLAPSADCVAVLFPPTRVPTWPSLS